MAADRFQVVSEVPDLPAEDRRPAESESRAASLLLLSLKALSQRAIAAIADLFFLLTVASAWWLWASIPNPSVYQIVSLAIYAVFVLTANFIVQRR